MFIKLNSGGYLELNRKFRGCRLVEGFVRAGGKPTAKNLKKLLRVYSVDANHCWKKQEAYQLGRLIGRQNLLSVVS